MSSDKTTGKVWLLFREVSDQYGTEELVGVFLDARSAELAEGTITNRRTFVKTAPVGRIFRKEYGSYGDYI